MTASRIVTVLFSTLALLFASGQSAPTQFLTRVTEPVENLCMGMLADMPAYGMLPHTHGPFVPNTSITVKTGSVLLVGSNDKIESSLTNCAVSVDYYFYVLGFFVITKKLPAHSPESGFRVSQWPNSSMSKDTYVVTNITNAATTDLYVEGTPQDGTIVPAAKGTNFGKTAVYVGSCLAVQHQGPSRALDKMLSFFLHIEDTASNLITPKGSFHGAILITPELGDEEEAVYYTLTYVFYERLGGPNFKGSTTNFNFQMFQATFFNGVSAGNLSSTPPPTKEGKKDKEGKGNGGQGGRKLLSMEDARREAAEIFGAREGGLVTGEEVKAASRKLQQLSGYYYTSGTDSTSSTGCPRGYCTPRTPVPYWCHYSGYGWPRCQYYCTCGSGV